MPQGSFPCHAAGEGLCNRYLRTEPLQQIGTEKKISQQRVPTSAGLNMEDTQMGGVLKWGNLHVLTPILVLIPIKTFGLSIYVLRFCSRLGGSEVMGDPQSSP